MHHGVKLLSKHINLPAELWAKIDIEVREPFERRIRELDLQCSLAPFLQWYLSTDRKDVHPTDGAHYLKGMTANDRLVYESGVARYVEHMKYRLTGIKPTSVVIEGILMPYPEGFWKDKISWGRNIREGVTEIGMKYQLK
jgi:hypothetical protein